MYLPNNIGSEGNKSFVSLCGLNTKCLESVLVLLDVNL